MRRITTIVTLCSALALAACGDDASGNNGNNGSNGSSNNDNSMPNSSTDGNNQTTGTNNGSNSTMNNQSNNNQTTGTNNGTTGTNNGTAGTNNGTGGEELTAETWGTRLFETYCEAAFDCVGTPFWIDEGLRYLLNTYGSKDACLAAAGDLAASGLYNDADFAAMVAEGRASFDETVAQGCLDAIGASICAEDFESDACDGLITGMVPDGDNCGSDEECAGDGSTCEGPDGQCYGSCGAPMCGTEMCNADQYCDTATDTCVDYAGDGEACEFSADCDPSMDLVCNYDSDAGSGVCVAENSVAAGEFCNFSSVCVADHYCADDDTCQPVRQDGESCGFGDCADGLVCNYDFDQDMGTCVTEGSVAENEFCVDSTVCMDGFYCDISDDICSPADKPAGSECVFGLECEDGLVCNFVGGTGTCTEPGSGAEGDDCDRDSICMDGLFCDFNAQTCTGPAADGETCTLGRPCAPALACLNIDEASGEGTCGALLDEGEDCQDFTQCAAPYACIDGTCSARNGEGELCTSDLHCESFSCDDASNSCEVVAACMLP